MLPLFGVRPTKKWLEKMSAESTFYSKGKAGKSGKPEEFSGDSQDKDARATDAIEKFSALILKPTYERLTIAGLEGLQRASPREFAALTNIPGTNEKDWGTLHDVPVSTKDIHLSGKQRASATSSGSSSLRAASGNDAGGSSGGGSGIPHSRFDTVNYLPWAPFSNTHSSKPFRKANCPDEPEANYPFEHKLVDIVTNWNPDNTEIPPFHYDSLCHFDYQNKEDYQKAMRYRTAERPFVVYNIPEVNDVVKKWNDLDYIHKKLGNKKYRTETSKTNHFMYWTNSPRFLRNNKDWEQPTDIVQEPFDKWLELAVKGQNKSLEQRTHEYFRVSSDMGNSWLFDELPFFQPKSSLWMVDPKSQRGIHCRFGMRSIIAEAHFDGSRNAIVSLGGLRRWILTHPKECARLHMYPKGHPSGRHSAADWSNLDLDKFPNMSRAMANEVIVQPGDILYLPTYWIHYIISLNVNFQCNTRSGRTSDFDRAIKNCGF
jgi:hypothetical protein